ncbi:siderophore ABC transporter substrate-binding protein [Paracoccus sp. TK19116]|uniref:Siderophore ABC transporter substrate-binding protein n=1 Tax=Paracoccus albicereus TaxID=2922394 RepID=A0ABT1MRP4_9RHOB|nr:siderophore ABC transporter substrate-binding protein [Paracoccus albicereus]MCQ0969556.1 siderophore ABC transporter substrate-binding protein [Paracoccus albicereus]
MLKILCAALAAFAGPALGEAIQIDTYRGPVSVTAMPETIAVLDMAALDSLQALNVEVAATTANVYLDYLREGHADAAHVGTLFEPDFEALNALQPDLIIAGGRSQEAVSDLERLAPTIDMTIWDDVIGEGLDRLAAYGALFGKVAKAKSLASEFEAKLEAARTAGAEQGRTLVLMTNGPKVSAYGPSGRFGWLYTAFGLDPVIADVEATTHGEAISFEFVRDADPDFLIVIDRAAAIGEATSARATLDNALVRETTAWREGKVAFLDSGPIYIAAGGIQSMNRTVDQLMAAFQGN